MLIYHCKRKNGAADENGGLLFCEKAGQHKARKGADASDRMGFYAKHQGKKQVIKYQQKDSEVPWKQSYENAEGNSNSLSTAVPEGKVYAWQLFFLGTDFIFGNFCRSRGIFGYKERAFPGKQGRAGDSLWVCEGIKMEKACPHTGATKTSVKKGEAVP